MIDIPNIVFKFLFPVDGIALIHLRPADDNVTSWKQAIEFICYLHVQHGIQLVKLVLKFPGIGIF
jgi:hypothetical protein